MKNEILLIMTLDNDLNKLNLTLIEKIKLTVLDLQSH